MLPQSERRHRLPATAAVVVAANKIDAGNGLVASLRSSISQSERRHLEVGLERARLEVSIYEKELEILAEEDSTVTQSANQDEASQQVALKQQAIARQLQAENRGKALVDALAKHAKEQATREEALVKDLRAVGYADVPPMQLPDYRRSLDAAQHAS